MGPRNLNQLVVLLCCFLAIFGCLHGGVFAHTTLDIMAFSHVRGDRVLLEVENNMDSGSNLSAGAQRLDPLDHFKKYRGGYNITNKHYWSSTIFTGRYGYIISALWLLGGIVSAGILIITNICFTNKERRENKRISCTGRYDFWPIILGVFFTFLAIVTSAIILGSSSRFYTRAESIKRIIVETAEEASWIMYDVTEAVTAMQNITELYGGLDGANRLNSTVQRLSEEAANIQRKAEKNMHLVNDGIKILEVVTIVAIGLNLFAVLALLPARSLRLHRMFFLLIVLCWLLTFLFWIYFGLYFFLDKFAGDTCAALNEYQLNPHNSTLSSILPCSEKLSDNMVLSDVGAGIHYAIDQVNANISTVKSSYISELEYVCNPFSGPPDYLYQPDNCSSNTMKIGDIPQILKKYTCSGGENCTQGEFISADDYNKVLIYTSSIQNILDVFPGMERLVGCHLVEDAFSDILLNQCKPLKKYVHIIWAALAVLSTIMMVIILISMVGAIHDDRYHANDGSVKPHPSSSDASGVHTAEMVSA
ncbi:uncharacterized protein [Typha angustifolia]|uniref:uncharacterized protein isoform X1 n=1 Tax=Typha angustifolia TaxID=59011 RepID=UPI003C2CD9E9